EAAVRNAKLAAVGQLAASVGHELRNPLAAVRNATTFIGKRLRDPSATNGKRMDPRILEFVDTADHELMECNRIITDPLEFARDRAPSRGLCPLRALADDALAIVPARENARVANEVPASLPVPSS